MNLERSKFKLFQARLLAELGALRWILEPNFIKKIIASMLVIILQTFR